MPLPRIQVGINRPTINMPEAVQGILGQYDVRPYFQVVTEKEVAMNVLTFWESELLCAEWPSAVHVYEFPTEIYDPEESEEEYEKQLEVVDNLHEERGQQGLTDLLLALAPYLNTSLTIQAVILDSDGTFVTAKEWTVRPGATEIQVKEINGEDAEHSIVERY